MYIFRQTFGLSRILAKAKKLQTVHAFSEGAFFWANFIPGFRNNRIHGISISKRTLPDLERNTHGGGDLRTTSERPRRISRQKIPKRTRILSIP